MSALTADLRKLPISERIQLVEDLWDSLAEDTPDSLPALADRIFPHDDRDRRLEELSARLEEVSQERDKARGDYVRLRNEAEDKLTRLMTRIKELNQGMTGVSEPKRKWKIFDW
jgi:putative addiction module component (TIGR02574 family)